MAELTAVAVPTLPVSDFLPLIGEERYRALADAGARTAALLRGSTFWNVNSTAAGGGVAEMLHVLVGYGLDAGLDARWVVIEGDPGFFRITKRIHNRLHGAPGDVGALGAREAAHYRAVSDNAAAALRRRVRPGDVVLLHDPQTAGLAAAMAGAGAHVIWRSHIGREVRNEWTDDAWRFLGPHLGACEAYVFSRSAYVPDWVEPGRARVITPSIDPFSPKNQPLRDDEVAAVLASIGLLDGPTYRLRDATRALIGNRATIVSEGPLDPGSPVVLQVSRWDRLKDMRGVMEGFASEVAGRVDADLVLAGPSTAGVADDPEGGAVLEECTAAWSAMAPSVRARIRLVSLPMADLDENATMVNALQRHATVVVQKSLAEGFGLTVSEAMWKSRAVVGSAVGGIVDQIAPATGVLLEDPNDLGEFGRRLAGLLEHPEEIGRLGANARRHVLANFVGDRHLIHYAELMSHLVAEPSPPTPDKTTGDPVRPP